MSEEHTEVTAERAVGLPVSDHDSTIGQPESVPVHNSALHNSAVGCATESGEIEPSSCLIEKLELLVEKLEPQAKAILLYWLCKYQLWAMDRVKDGRQREMLVLPNTNEPNNRPMQQTDSWKLYDPQTREIATVSLNEVFRVVRRPESTKLVSLLRPDKREALKPVADLICKLFDSGRCSEGQFYEVLSLAKSEALSPGGAVMVHTGDEQWFGTVVGLKRWKSRVTGVVQTKAFVYTRCDGKQHTIGFEALSVALPFDQVHKLLDELQDTLAYVRLRGENRAKMEEQVRLIKQGLSNCERSDARLIGADPAEQALEPPAKRKRLPAASSGQSPD